MNDISRMYMTNLERLSKEIQIVIKKNLPQLEIIDIRFNHPGTKYLKTVETHIYIKPINIEINDICLYNIIQELEFNIREKEGYKLECNSWYIDEDVQINLKTNRCINRKYIYFTIPIEYIHRAPSSRKKTSKP